MELLERAMNESPFKYTVEVNPEWQNNSLKMTGEQVHQKTQEENMEDHDLPTTRENGETVNEENDEDFGDGEDKDDFESRLVIDMSHGSGKCNGSVSPMESRRHGDTSPVDDKMSSDISPPSVTGASKRKRKTNMGHVLSSIVKARMGGESSQNDDNSSGYDDTNSQSSEGSYDGEHPAPKKHITEAYQLNSSIGRQSPAYTKQIPSQTAQSDIIRTKSPCEEMGPSEVLNLSKPTDSVLNLSKQDVKSPVSVEMKDQSPHTPVAPLNLSTSASQNSGSSRKNRRKTSMPTRCDRTEAVNANEYIEEYDGARLTNGYNKTNEEPMNLSSPVHNYDVPLDLTPKAVTHSNAKKAVASPISFAQFARDLNKKTTNGPVDLSARSSPVNMVSKVPVNATRTSPVNLKSSTTTTPSTKMHHNLPSDIKPMNLGGMTFPPMPGMPAMFAPGLPPNMSPLMSSMKPDQMKEFLDLMSKIQKSVPNQNMMQANAQLMQFHALMQSAMMNNSLVNPLSGLSAMNNNINKFASSISSDKNDNIIKSEPAVLKTADKPHISEASNEFQKFNLTKNNPMMPANGFMPPFSGFPGAMPGFPFMQNSMLLPQKGTPGRRRKTKEPSAYSNPSTPDKNITIPKLEDIPMLRTHVDNSNPQEVVETLKKIFPAGPTTPNKSFNAGNNGGNNECRFFVKDNEQIQSIVDSLLLVCEIQDSELARYAGDQGYKNICRLCDTTFFHIEHLTKHIKKAHIVKRFQCDQCERSFHDAGNYRQHMRVHDDSDIPFECPECKRRFRHKCTLKVHMRIHTGEKPFKCEICSASFKISSGLQTHMRKHTGETPYACEHCSMRFKCQSNLKQHLFQHTQARPFTCDICNKSYSRKSIRDAHVLTHGKELNQFGTGKMDMADLAKMADIDVSQIPELSPVADLPLVGSPEMPSLSSPDVPVMNGRSVLAGQ